MLKKIPLILITLLFVVGSYLATQTRADDRACERRCRDLHRDELRVCNDFHGEARARCIREANERLRHCLQRCR